MSELRTRGAELRHGARRLARRALRPPAGAGRTEPPPAPLGGKLEITYACNLRCGFCYTDSPRRTLQRTPELSDAEWLTVADELIEIGAIEAVVTGGEPLLRRDLTIEVCRRLAEAGLGVTLNTNGWFVDDEVASRLAAAPGLQVHVSVDGPSPEVHDPSRGLPGSWRRAILGLDALIRHGVAVHAVHVVTAANAERVEETLDLLIELGVTAIAVTRVVEVGAAAREGGWRVASGGLERAVARAQRAAGDDAHIALRGGEGGVDSLRAQRPPSALLVRPDGAVRTDSLNPFAFGRVPGEELATAWARVRERWRDPRVEAWRTKIGSPTGWSAAPVVPYLDDEVDLTGADRAEPTENPRLSPVPPPVSPEAVTSSRIEDPRGFVRELVAGRRHRHGRVRIGGPADGRVIRRVEDGRVHRLNPTASVVFDALAGGTPRAAADALADAHPSIPADDLTADSLRATRRMLAAGLVIPLEASGSAAPAVGSTPDLPGADPG